jgi:hypothetical protein
MPQNLNILIALTKQAYGELIGLVPLDSLQGGDFGYGSKRVRVEELLGKLNSQIIAIQRTLSEHVIESSESPILTIPPEHRAFYNEVVVPQSKTLQRAYFDISGLSNLFDILEDSESDKPNPQIHNAMRWGLERWNDMLDEDESIEWLERGFNIVDALKLVDMPWFRPDEWSRNFKLLQPVLIDRSPKVMRDHVHYRLTEIYRAFAFGLWMAAIALSRSLVEFSIKANASRIGISVTYEGTGGRIEDKSLKWLGEDVANARPALAKPIEVVRNTGNRILHPKKHDVIAHPKVMHTEALECIRAAKLIVENLYSEVPPSV